MSLTRADANERSARILVIAFAVGLAGVLLSAAIGAIRSAEAETTGPPSMTRVTSSADHKTMFVTFSEAVYTEYDAAASPAASGDLKPGDFSFTDADGDAIASPSFTVAKDGSGLTTWKLAFTNAFTPNAMSLNVRPSEIHDATGDSAPAQAMAAPLDQAALTELLTGFKTTKLPMNYKFDNSTTDNETDDYEVSQLPFIGDWFESVPAMPTMIGGLSDVTGPLSQAELETALEGLDAVGEIAFDANGMTVGLATDATPPEPPMTGGVGIGAVGLTADSVSTQGKVTVTGSLTYDSTGTGAVVDTTNDAVTVKVDASQTLTDLKADLGFAEATIDSSKLVFQPSLSLALGCVTGTSTSCAPDKLVAQKPTIGGTGSWDLDSVSVTSGLGKKTFAPAAGVLGVDFNLSNGFDDQTDFLTLDTTGLKATGLDGFNRVSMTSVLSGLGWLSTWLTEVEGHGAMNGEIPLIGGSVGELARVSGELAEEVAGLSDKINEDLDDDGKADDPHVSAQEAIKVLCESGLASPASGKTCADLIDPFELVIEDGKLKGIEYGIDVELDHDFFNATNSPVLDLGVEGSGLEGISLNMEPGGWDGSATSKFAFKLGIKTGPVSDIESQLELTAADFDGDEVANVDDWDADGDNLDDDADDGLKETPATPLSNEGTDGDDDADGMPEDYTLVEGDLCRGLYGALNTGPPALGMSFEAFARANGVWITDIAPDKDDDQGGIDPAVCDAKAKKGTLIKTPSNATGTGLTAEQLCTAGAAVQGLPDLEDGYAPALTNFRSANGYADDAACATALEAAGSRTFSYDHNGRAFGSPVTIGHRIYVDTGKLADVGLDVTGKGLKIAANLGFLDLAITSVDTIDDSYGVKLDPSFAVTLVDPGTGAADSKIDLMEMAEAADRSKMSSLVSFAVTGDAEAHFDLANGVLATKQLDIIGDFSALDNAFTTPKTDVFNLVEHRLEDSSDADYVADRINIGHNLGDYLELKDLTAADVIQILVNLSDQISGMAGSEVLALEIPFTGTTLADAVQFSKTFADIAAAIESADPQSLSAFEDSLSSALKAAGMPGAITPHVTGESLSFSFDASRTTEAVYPFSLDPEDYGIPSGIPFLPSDGGASVAMTAGMQFTPELGILFDGTGIKDRIFVKNFVPKFTASLDGTTHGTINIGPFATTMDGNLTVADPGDDEELGSSDDVPAAVTMTMTDPTTSTAMTIADLETVVADLDAKSSLAITGDFDAGMSVAQPRGGLTASGSLDDLFRGNFENIESEANIDFSSISLNLDTFVTGASQTSRWIGDLMQQSRSYSAEIPLVGDKLTKLADVGGAMSAMADSVDAAWADAKGNANKFKTELEADLKADIEGAFPADVPVVAEPKVIWTDKDGNYPIDATGKHDPDYDGPEATFGVAGGLVVKLKISLIDTETTSLPGGLDVPPVLELDARISPEVTYGFTVAMGLGVSVNEGFYVVGEDDGTLLDAFAKLDVPIDVDKVAVGGANIAKIQGGKASIGGTIGPKGTDGKPDTNAAGFAVAIVPAPDAAEDSIPQISLADLVGKKKRADQPVDARFSIDAKIDLPLKTTFPKIPNLTLPMHFKWKADGSVSGGAQIGKPSLSIGSGNDTDDDQITLDAKELLKEVIAPTLVKANEYNPFSKVPMIKTTLDSNIPVLETSMRKIARQFMGSHPAWTMFEFLLDLDQVAKDVKDAADKLTCPEGSPPGCGEIKLGWVEVVGDSNNDGVSASGRHPYTEAWHEQAGFGPLVTALEKLMKSAGGNGTLKRPTKPMPAPTTGGTVASTADTNTVNPILPVADQPTTGDGSGPCPTSAKPPAPAGATTSPKIGRNIGKYGCLFSFPIMDDPMTAIGMVLKGDFSETVSFFEFRPPPINVGPSIAWSKTLFDMNTGIIDGSLTVGFDGALGLTARMGFGFDSSGLVQGRFPLDGFYLIDYKDPSTGRDLNEVEIGGRVAGFINGRFSIAGGLGSAQFEGAAGVNATAGLDFNDESEAILPEDRNDGRFHFREMKQVALAAYHRHQGSEAAKVLQGVLCTMKPSADLSAFLSVSGSAKALGVTVFDKSYSDSWDLLDMMGIPKTVNCPPPDRIAQVIDGQLVLNGGANAANRLNGGTDIAEGFNITQSGNDLTVSWTGTGSMTPSSLTFDVAEENITEIVADLGAGNDSVAIAAGVTLPATLSGGAGADSFTGGGADDQLDGGPGSDTLKGSGGVDVLLGGTGNDSLTGGADNDDLQGGDSTNETSNDTYTFSGAWGNDTVEDPDGREKFVFATSAALTGNSEFADALITDGTNSVEYYVDEIDEIRSGSGSDDFTIKSQVPTGFLLNGGGGNDETHVEYMGQDRSIEVQGGPGDADVFHALGTPGPDLFLSRGNSTAIGTKATTGSLYMLADQFPEDEPYNPDDDLADRVKYNNSIEKLLIETLDDKDQVVMDDNAAATQIDGGLGSDRFQVGQIYGKTRTHVFTQETTRGHLSKGASYPTTINGNFTDSDIPADPNEVYVAPTTYSDDDYFQVYSNQAELDLNGNEGDDTFVVRAFVIAGSVTENATTIGEDVDLGGGVGADQFEYVQNKLVDVDGGRGFDTFIIVGTEYSDGFLVGKDGVKICDLAEINGEALPDPTKCAINTVYTNIEKVLGQGMEGSDVFQMLSTTDAASTAMFGGEDGDRFVVGDAGNVTGIKGPLTVRGESDPEFDSSITDPTVLPGESAAGATAQCSDGIDNENEKDGKIDYPEDPQCTGPDDPREGVSGTLTDSMLVNASAHTVDDTGDNDFDLEAGDPTGAVTGLGMWTGGELSSTATSGRSQRFDAGVVYGDLEFAVVQLGSGNDTFNVNSTHLGTTTVRGGSGADQVNVKTIAGTTVVRGEAGDDRIDAGTTAPAGNGVVEELDALLDVYGNDGGDKLYVDDSAEDVGQTVSSDQISEQPAGADAAYARGQLLGIGMSTDGIKYDTLELVDVELGSEKDYIDVRGTITNTVFHGNDGDERFYASSDAALTQHDTDFLTGQLDDVDGDVTFDGGNGRHQMMVSDEASATGDGDSGDRVAIDEDSIEGLSDGDINYDTDAVTNSAAGDFADGVSIWTGTGADALSWSGSRRDADVRTVTTLNTNGGGDDVLVDLATTDGSSVLNTEDGSDVVDASASSLGLLVFGGSAADDLTAGSGADVVVGDTGLITYENGGATTTIHGNGTAAGDKTDGVERTIATIASTGTGDSSEDGDAIAAGPADDKVIAGNGVDQVEGGTGDDDITGDAATFTAGQDSEWTSQRPGEATSGSADALAGDAGNDWILGQHGADRILGGALVGMAEMAGADTVGDGNDILIGDHDVASGIASGDDFAGDNGDDLVLGDNAEHERGTSITLLDVQAEGAFVDASLNPGVATVIPSSASGGDNVYGNADEDRVYGQGGGDSIDGGSEDDYIEGNHGEDTVFGGPHNDDILGGGSSVTGVISSTSVASGPLDGTDHLFGDDSDTDVAAAGDGHDVILGDNGHIERDGRVLDAALYPDHPVRQVSMADSLPGATSGGDEIRGNGGNDELYGQLDAGGDANESALTAGCSGTDLSIRGDVLCGDAGQDALVGDRGVVTVRTSESQPNANTRIRSSSPFIDETILKPGDLFYVTTLETSKIGGDDLIFGGTERDSIHAGAAADLVNGDAGDDAVFGGLGDDDLWGGVDHDRIYGGHGADEIDLKLINSSPATWSVVAPLVDRDGDASTVNDGDLIYGGWDADIQQADVGDAGTGPGDRMIDWTGSYNLFYVCNGAYGAGRVQREFSPNFAANLQKLAVADGSTSVTAKSASGDDELGLVNKANVKHNTKPRHPLWPGNFTCES